MRFVGSEQLNGGRICALTNRTTDPEGFFDTGRLISDWSKPVSLSAAAVKEAARSIGWVSAEEHAEVKQTCETLREAVNLLEDELTKLESLRDTARELVS